MKKASASLDNLEKMMAKRMEIQTTALDMVKRMDYQTRNPADERPDE